MYSCKLIALTSKHCNGMVIGNSRGPLSEICVSHNDVINLFFCPFVRTSFVFFYIATMFNRRRSRLEPTYTGVNHVAPSNTAPNSNALAAALSIGKSLKQPPQQQPAQTIRRSGSIQYITKPLEAKNQQPAKRSSMTSSTSSYSLSQGTGRLRQPLVKDSNNHHFNDIDDSFTDLFLNDITEEPQLPNINQEGMKDLRLTHNPKANGSILRRTNLMQSRRVSGLNSLNRSNLIQGNNPSHGQKMVTRYIPTPTGIKTIQVPESSFKEEVARNNSLRANSRQPGSLRTSSLRNLSIGRSPSLSSVRAPRPPLRLSSLMEPTPEETNQQQLRELDRQIAEEKKMQEKLKEKQREFEELKKQRLRLEAENSRRQNRQSYDEHFDLPDVIGDAPIENKRVFEHDPINHVELDEVPDTKEPQNINAKHDYPLVDTSHLDTTHMDDSDMEDATTTIDNSDLEDAVAEVGESDSPQVPSAIDASDLIVDEVEKKEIINDVNENAEHSSLDDNSPLDKTAEPSPAHAGEQTAVDGAAAEAESHIPAIDVDDLGVIEAPYTLQLPSAGGSTASSIRSGDSRSPERVHDKSKRPVKLAMKVLKLQYTLNDATPSSNAARDAYLSLTTAENTRLNSKLLSSQLSEPHPLHAHPQQQQQQPPPPQPQFAQPHNQNKRMSTLRKLPSIQDGALATRTLRPQSHVEPVQNGGMSGRSLRSPTYQPHTIVQPPPPHPALQPNYQSPSKLKAAELYAKAQARPVSVFKPMPRKSSYTKENGEEVSVPRHTLRDDPQRVASTNSQQDPNQRIASTNSQQVPSNQVPPEEVMAPRNPQVNGSTNARAPKGKTAPHTTPVRLLRETRIPERNPERLQPSTENRGFRSRFADSDDETSLGGGVGGGVGGGEFALRFADSDDEGGISSFSNSHSGKSKTETPTKTLRKEEKPKEEKKKFGKLRKLFGKS